MRLQCSSHDHQRAGLDSLDVVEVLMAIEEEFAVEIADEEADKIQSVQQAIEFIATHPGAK